MSCMLTNMVIEPYVEILGDILQQKYGFNEIEAGELFTIPFYVGCLVSPFVGYFADNYGYRTQLIISSSFFLIIGHLSSTYL